ncbi:MAG: hypothetical protein R6W78_01130 [Bacteroidales bacterium]
MKHIKILASVLVCIVFLSVCEKEQESKTTNSFKYDGKEYSITQGCLIDRGISSSGGDRRIDLILLSESFTIVDSVNELKKILGIGHFTEFYMYSSSATGLDSTRYTYDLLDVRKAGTYGYGRFGIDYEIETQTGFEREVDSGTLTVSKTGAKYEITINCTDKNAKSFTGYYKGALNFYP